MCKLSIKTHHFLTVSSLSSQVILLIQSGWVLPDVRNCGFLSNLR